MGSVARAGNLDVGPVGAYRSRTASAPLAGNQRIPTWLLVLPLVAFLLLGVAWPAAHLIRGLGSRAGVAAFARVLGAGRYRIALVNSIALSSAASLAAVLLAIVPAWTLARIDFRGRSILRTFVLLPMTFSGVLVGFLMIAMLGRVGFVPRTLELLFGAPLLSAWAYDLRGLFLAYLYFEVPRAVLTLEPACRAFPGELSEAARTLGAGRIARLVLVVVPTLLPALRSALAVTFAASMGSFGVALMLSRRFTVAPLEIYTEITGFNDMAVAGALAVVLAAAALAGSRVLADRGLDE